METTISLICDCVDCHNPAELSPAIDVFPSHRPDGQAPLRFYYQINVCGPCSQIPTPLESLATKETWNEISEIMLVRGLGLLDKANVRLAFATLDERDNSFARKRTHRHEAVV